MFWCLNFAEYKVKSSNYERSTSSVNLVVCNEEYTKKEPKDHDHKNIQRFLSECEVMFILRHPCVSCIIVVNNDHLPSIILSLESAIAKKKLEQHKKCRITVDNEWFDTFHRNFMHSDLKPSNILISKGKQGWISDFKKRVWTLPFMTPELLVEDEKNWNSHQTNKIDVYSILIILIRIVTGSYPKFNLRNVSNGILPPLPDTIVNLVSELIKICLFLEPENNLSFV